MIDVTTTVGKTLVGAPKTELVKALKLPLFVLFVKPDFTRYQLTACDGSKNPIMHLSELKPIE